MPLGKRKNLENRQDLKRRVDLMADEKNIVLVDKNPLLIEAWNNVFDDLDFVKVYEGSIFDVDCDAVVSPANSFGFMDGGIDYQYSQHFGWDVQEEVQHKIKLYHDGELLVGNALEVKTGNEDIPYLIAAPTMRVPMILKDSINTYLATRAVMLMLKYRLCNIVKTVAFPGMGTGVGQMRADICAGQMRAAIDKVLNGKTFPHSWDEAQAEHQLLYKDTIRDLQHEGVYG